MEEFEIGCIEFGVLSPDEIRATSVAELTSSKVLIGTPGSVYAEELGTLSSLALCTTCNANLKQCPGHYGHINLVTPCIHPLLVKNLLNVLKCLCAHCRQFLCPPPASGPAVGSTGAKEPLFRQAVKSISKTAACTACGATSMRYTYVVSENQIYMHDTETPAGRIFPPADIRAMLDAVPLKQWARIGIDALRAHPRDFVITTLLVMAPRSRPYVVSESQAVCDDDLTLTYSEIVKLNKQLQAAIDSVAAGHQENAARVARLTQTLNFRLRAMFDNSAGMWVGYAYCQAQP